MRGPKLPGWSPGQKAEAWRCNQAAGFATLTAVTSGGPQHDGGKGAFIYALVDPRDGTVRYVGFTTNMAARLVHHIEGKQPNKQMAAWRSELLALGAAPQMVLLEETSKAVWGIAERAWIACARSRGRIYNYWPGGEGFRKPKR
jgi:hypothetical protein